MFTIEQIKKAHTKVKSGSDFPAYVQEIKKLGVVSYDNYVTDGHTLYYGQGNFEIKGDAKYEPVEVTNNSSKEKLNNSLKIHQQGQTDYLTFCKQAAEAGVEKWSVNLVKMTCTYFDKENNAMVIEEIPEA